MTGTRAAVFGVRPQTVRRGPDGKTDIYAWERALRRHGFDRIAGADEAGRGACAGPLVVGAVVLPEGKRGVVPGLADSKLLTESQRERVYHEVTRRAIDWTAVIVPPQVVDRIGLHVANLRAMRQAVSRLQPGFAVTDGFPVPGIPSPGLAMWKGDLVAACVAAASVIAKVTRDRMMGELDGIHPGYGFASHKGYCTPEHQEALERLGPCVEHRFSYANVRAAAGLGQTAGMEVI
jgi:ribonuclease HII